MSQNSTLSLALLAALSLSALSLSIAPASAERINQLIQVTQLKAQNANDEALQGNTVKQAKAGQVAEPVVIDPQAADANRSQAEKRLSDHRNEMRRNWAP